MMVETQNEISISQDQSFLFQLTIRLLHRFGYEHGNEIIVVV